NTISVLLGNGNGTFRAATTLPAAKGSSGLALGDVNADGKLDLATGDGLELASIYLGNGNGTFGLRQDIVRNLTGFISKVALYDGGRLDGGEYIAVADFNGDGFADAAMDHYSGGMTVLNIGLGDNSGGFGFVVNAPIAPHLIALASADFDGDGRPEVVGISRK